MSLQMIRLSLYSPLLELILQPAPADSMQVDF